MTNTQDPRVYEVIGIPVAGNNSATSDEEKRNQVWMYSCHTERIRTRQSRREMPSV